MITLTSEYLVELDERNYTLKRKYKMKKPADDGSDQYEYATLGYYANLQNAVKGAIDDMNIRKLSKGTHDLLEAIEIINKNNAKFERILKKAIKEVNV